MCCCEKCVKVCGTLFLVLGVVFLLGDLNYWNFWNINWWTALFLLVGVGGLASSKCLDCQKSRKK